MRTVTVIRRPVTVQTTTQATFLVLHLHSHQHLRRATTALRIRIVSNSIVTACPPSHVPGVGPHLPETPPHCSVKSSCRLMLRLSHALRSKMKAMPILVPSRTPARYWIHRAMTVSSQAPHDTAIYQHELTLISTPQQHHLRTQHVYPPRLRQRWRYRSRTAQSSQVHSFPMAACEQRPQPCDSSARKSACAYEGLLERLTSGGQVASW